jgi:hypothetical protein
MIESENYDNEIRRHCDRCGTDWIEEYSGVPDAVSVTRGPKFVEREPDNLDLWEEGPAGSPLEIWAKTQIEGKHRRELREQQQRKLFPKKGATEEDRAEAADQRAQADEEKAEAERNIADSDQLKEAARAALGFPKEAIFPGDALTFVNNLVIDKQNAQNPATGYGMSEEEEREEEKRKLRATLGFPKESYQPNYDDFDPSDYDQDLPPCSDDDDLWSDINSEAVNYSWRLFKKFISGLKQMGWAIPLADWDSITGLEEESEGWIHAMGSVDFEGKGGQKIRLPRGKSIVLDRIVKSELWLWAAHESEDVEVEVGTGKYDGDGWNDPREEIMGYVDVECPDPKGVSAIGFSYEGEDEPLKWFSPNQTDKMLELFARTFPKELGIRSKVKKRGEDVISKEGQAIRAALGFSKESAIRSLVKFRLPSRVVMTRGVSEAAKRNRKFGSEVRKALFDYQHGKWGKTQRDSVKRNNAVLKDGVEDQVFAVYDTDEGDIYIITEWDKSATTILFSHEY